MDPWWICTLTSICVGGDDVVRALHKLTGNVPGLSDVSLELIAARQEVGIQGMIKLCQRVKWIENAN